jgi:hypothetical protein
MKHQKVNHAAVWLNVIVCQVLSVIWFSPLLFAHKWMYYLGKTFADFNGESFSGLVFSVAGAAAFSYFLSWLFIKLGINTGAKGLSLAVILCLCCFVFTTFTQDSFSLRPAGLSLINTGNITVNFSVAGFLLGSWRKYHSTQSLNT